MTSPTDEDLNRLRNFHNLDLTNIETIEDLEIALANTEAKAGSKFDSKKQSELRVQLIDDSKLWFGLSKVQEVVEVNNIERISNITDIDALDDYTLPENINNSVESSLAEEISNTRDGLLSDVEEKASRLRSVKSLRDLRRFSDSEALQIIDERIAEVQGETERNFMDFQRAIQSTTSEEQAEAIVGEALESENISDSNKELLGRLAILRFEE